MPRQTIARYGPPTQILHWLTAILVLVAFAYGPGGSEARAYAAARDFDRQLHETLGLAVLALVALRVLWRAIDARPTTVQAARWMDIAAKLVQAALYALLFAVPISGIVGAWLEGHALTLLAGVTFPPRVAESHALGVKVARLHTWLGDAILWLAGLHALAALFHHYVLRDGVLESMLPRRPAKNS
jgi:cytochrome b561